MAIPFNAGKHPRSAGGRFGATGAAQAAAAGHPTGAWATGPVRRGVGRKGAADPRVTAMQRQLNALGYGDERGRPLLVDGIDGNHTTASVKAFQRANGLPVTGEVDAKTMVAILTAKPKPKPAKTTARQRMSRRAPTRHTASSPARKAPAPVAVTRTGSVGGKEPPALY